MSKEIFRSIDANLHAFPVPLIFQSEKPADLLGLQVRIESCKSEHDAHDFDCVCFWIGVLANLTEADQTYSDESGYTFKVSCGNLVFILDRDQFVIIH